MDKIKNIEFRTADDEITVQDRDRSSGTDEVPVQRVVVFVRLDGHLSVEKKTFQTGWQKYWAKRTGSQVDLLFGSSPQKRFSPDKRILDLEARQSQESKNEAESKKA